MVNIIDVGANFGSFGLELAKRNSQTFVHMIEPVPDLARELRVKCATEGVSNILVHELALAETDGEAELFVSVSGDCGTTSMLPFDEGKISTDPYWAQRSDLRHETKVRVQTLRLSTFMEKNGIDQIDFIKIDVQGLDLAVLASAGDYISSVRAGMLEVCTTEKNALYFGEKQDLRIVLNFLEDHGFKVVAIKPNDPACNEVNVFFSRDPETWDKDTVAWGLFGLPAFDGKHYWHACSSSPEYGDDLNRQLQAENLRLRTRLEVQDVEIDRLSKRISDLDFEIARICEHIVK
ncbi:methyltransferase, FkbM family [Pseudomonas peli]|jgi:FkbM family methyltransferase|uniref:Methyltransferase, FkbM family n=1 Tax=Pseudomonas peli TaxID=592361 RepID=A0AB37Z2Y5_9PSED|nr:FkbM family methyltransferase [Pseudomonas peli]NMZ69245.1 FkbM family methyltransferase [Pseudomonas peli]SCW33161.1 methyltransferase, FkbM family [Pseudomonas peli]